MLVLSSYRAEMYTGRVACCSVVSHITPLLVQLCWLRVPENTKYKLCVLVYRYLHGTAPEYLTNSFQRASDVTSRRHLRSATSQLTVSATRCSTLGDRAFPVAAARAWNALPHSVSSASSLPTFRPL